MKAMKRAIAILIMLLALLSIIACATMSDNGGDKGGKDAVDAETRERLLAGKRNLSAKSVIKADMKSIDLRKWNLKCNGRLRQMMDTIEGAMVKGLVCYEKKYASFAYYFNEMPFFYAIMAMDYEKNEMTPLKGYEAYRQKAILKETSLTNPPHLPTWAFGPNRKPLKSIYKDNPKYNRFRSSE